jgi:hypothetical protein
VEVHRVASMSKKRLAAATDAPEDYDVVGKALMSDVGYNRLLEHFIDTRKGREGLGDYRDALDDHESTTGDQDVLSSLEALLALDSSIVPNLRPGEGVGLHERLESYVLRFLDGLGEASSVPVELLNAALKMIADAKINFPMSDKLHPMTACLAKRVATSKQKDLTDAVVDAAKKVGSKPTCSEMAMRLTTALESARGVKFEMAMGPCQEENAVAFARFQLCNAMAERQVSTDFGDMSKLLHTVDLLNCCAASGMDEPHFKALHTLLVSFNSIMLHCSAFLNSQGDNDSLKKSLVASNWLPLVEFKRLRQAFEVDGKVVQANNYGTVIDKPNLGNDMVSAASAIMHRLHAFATARVSDGHTSLEAACKSLAPHAKGGANEKSWTHGMKKKASIEDIAAQASKPGNLMSSTYPMGSLISGLKELTTVPRQA